MAAMVQTNQEGPTSGAQDQNHQDLTESLMMTHKRNMDLASENAALKEQLASKESSWEEEKEIILKGLRTERAKRKQAEKDLKAKEREMKELVTTKPKSQTKNFTMIHNEALQDLKKKLQDSRNTNTDLASEVTALKEQLARKEAMREEEEKILQAERAISKPTERDLKAKELVTTESQTETISVLQDEALQDLKKKLLDQEEVINSLRQSLLDEQKKTFYAKEELKHITVQHQELDSRITRELNTKWETKWCEREEKMDLELQTLREHHEREMSQVIQEKDDHIANITSDKKALEAESLEFKARLEEMERRFIQREEEWEMKLTTLEDQKSSESSAEERSSIILTQSSSDLQELQQNQSSCDLQELQQNQSSSDLQELQQNQSSSDLQELQQTAATEPEKKKKKKQRFFFSLFSCLFQEREKKKEKERRKRKK